jgi:hypothetical protein
MHDPSTPQSEKHNATNSPEPPEVVGERVIRLAFGGDRDRYDRFVRTLKEAIPPDVTILLRGSAVTGKRWGGTEPFDHDGPGTSDLDLTLVGGEMVKHFEVFYIPGLHSVPLGDAHPDASMTLIPLQRALTEIAQRPVNIQATADLTQYVRDIVMNQPYFTLVAKDDAETVDDGGTS